MADDATVSTTMAKRDHLQLGSTVSAYGTVFTAQAIVDSDNRHWLC
jgi:hypothetical protein